MKICFVSPYAYPLFNAECQSHFGGGEVQLFQLALALSRETTFAVHFVVADFGQASKEQFEHITVHKSFPLRTDFKKNKPALTCSQVHRAITLLSVLWRINADVYIQRCAGTETGITACIASILKKKFIYMTSHDIDCNGEFIKAERLRGVIYKYGLTHASFVFAQSAGHQHMLKRTHGIDSHILPTGYNIPAVNTETRRHVLWVGRIEEWKHPELFVALAKSMPDVQFLMIAPRNCPDAVYDAFLEDIKTVSNLTYIPRVKFADIDDYFKKAQVLVNTSRYEGFPNTFVQAFKYGVPVLSLNVSPDDILDKHSVGFLCETLDNLRERLAELLQDHVLYERYSKNAYTYAKEYHALPMVISRFKDFINFVQRGDN